MKYETNPKMISIILLSIITIRNNESETVV